MGSALQDVIDAAGGVANGHVFKAAHIGGPVGYMLGPDALGWELDYDLAHRHGVSMGAGGVYVLDDDTSIISYVLANIRFLMRESCGQCTPCREGLTLMRDVLEHVDGDDENHEWRDGTIWLIEQLSNTMGDASLCALGRGAANTVTSMLANFDMEALCRA
jgi:NADH-quinone oxidoreductase subunit F